MRTLIFSVVCLGVFLWLDGYHIVWNPTPDQLYGCTIEQQAPNEIAHERA